MRAIELAIELNDKKSQSFERFKSYGARAPLPAAPRSTVHGDPLSAGSPLRQTAGLGALCIYALGDESYNSLHTDI